MEIGKVNRLRINRAAEQGLYLADSEGAEVLLPRHYVLDTMLVGNEMEVFVYRDSEDRLVATTEHPLAMVGEVRLMRVKRADGVGAWLDWGLQKDLLVPHREQKVRMVAGRWYVVYIYLDDVSQRLVASAKLDKFIDNTIAKVKVGDEVMATVYQRTDLGYKMVVENLWWGMVYHNELNRELNIGERVVGRVRHVREDNRIDLTLKPREKERVSALAVAVEAYIRRHGGSIDITDRSNPDLISAVFGCSKKDYKKALGALYKQRKISISTSKIDILEDADRH